MDGQMSGQSGEEEQQTVVTGEEGIQNGFIPCKYYCLWT